MNYQYFADKPDKIDILNYIFSETDLQVFELGSPFGKEIQQFRSVEEIILCFDLHLEGTGALFMLWSPRHGRRPTFKRIELNPKHCNGFTFR